MLQHLSADAKYPIKTFSSECATAPSLCAITKFRLADSYFDVVRCEQISDFFVFFPCDSIILYIGSLFR
jgi:hypothetical protein